MREAVSQTTSPARDVDAMPSRRTEPVARPARHLSPAVRTLASRSVPVVGLLALVVFFSITAGDRFMTTSNWLTLVQQAAVVAIIGFGLSFVIIAGSIDLSVGAVAGLAGMVTAGVGTAHGAVAGVVAGLLTGAVCGLVNGVLLALLRVPSFIATLGALSMAAGVTLVYSHSESKPVPTALLRLGTQPGIYVVLGLAMLVALALFNVTTFGRYTRALGGDERVAALSGVPVRRIKIAIFAFGGLMAALAGIVLSARLGVADPQAGTGFELTAISAVVVGGTPLTGGIGNIWNTVIGALVIQVLANGLVILGVTPEVQQIVQGAIIIVAVLVALDRRKIGVIK